MKTTFSKRDKITASVVGGAIGAAVCTPPYVLGRVGLLMLGSTRGSSSLASSSSLSA